MNVIRLHPEVPNYAPPFRPEAIPAALRGQARWAPWKAVWNARRGKWDKVPCALVAPYYGLSTAKPERWASFDVALAALRANPGRFAGLGYVMTRPHGMVGIDLDDCVADGVVAPWAQQIIDDSGTYAEYSPSGAGVRLFTSGETVGDWTNHEQGIEVYSGHEPRFLTVTGAHLPGTPSDVLEAPDGVLSGLAQRYARERSAPTTPASSELPELIDELALPDISALGLPYQTLNFLTDGDTRGDRSRELFAAAVALHQAGLDEAQVLSVLAASPHAMEVALDHRRQDPDRALRYLWVEHALKAKGRGTSRVASAADFEDVSGGVGPEAAPGGAAAEPGKKPNPFRPLTIAEFRARPKVNWLLKGLLPERGVGMVYGPSTAGKTFFLLDMCMSVARGIAWRGRKVKQKSIAYIVGEGVGGFPSRLAAYEAHHGIDLNEVPLRLIPQPPNLLATGDIALLVEALREMDNLGVVVFDTLSQSTPGADENSGKDMGAAMANCQRIAQKLGVLVVLVGHPGKDESRGVRGWSGMFASFDFVFQVEREGRFRAATVAKLKDGQGEGDEYPFTLVSVDLGVDEDGEVERSAVACENGDTAPKRPPKGRHQQLLLETLETITSMDGAPTEAQLIKAVAAQMERKGTARDTRALRAKEAFDALVVSGRLSVDGGLVSERA